MSAIADVDRRSLLIGATGAAAASLASCSTNREAQLTSAKKLVFLLVHGAWHGGWCWTRVAALLQAEGHTVYAPTLTGLGERSHLLSDGVNLTTHINDVVNEVTWKDLTGVVLCGHSYGGMVITGVAERIADRIASIVYLDAFWPVDGQSLNDISGAQRPTSGGIPPHPLEIFNVNQSDAAWVGAKLTPQPAATFAERLTVTGALDRIPRRTFIQATVGAAPFFASAYQRARASPGWDALQVDCGHDVMIDRPADLARMLLRAA